MQRKIYDPINHLLDLGKDQIFGERFSEFGNPDPEFFQREYGDSGFYGIYLRVKIFAKFQGFGNLQKEKFRFFWIFFGNFQSPKAAENFRSPTGFFEHFPLLCSLVDSQALCRVFQKKFKFFRCCSKYGVGK
jgi:hypothetical protein